MIAVVLIDPVNRLPMFNSSDVLNGIFDSLHGRDVGLWKKRPARSAVWMLRGRDKKLISDPRERDLWRLVSRTGLSVDELLAKFSEQDLQSISAAMELDGDSQRENWFAIALSSSQTSRCFSPCCAKPTRMNPRKFYAAKDFLREW